MLRISGFVLATLVLTAAATNNSTDNAFTSTTSTTSTTTEPYRPDPNPKISSINGELSIKAPNVRFVVTDSEGYDMRLWSLNELDASMNQTIASLADQGRELRQADEAMRAALTQDLASLRSDLTRAIGDNFDETSKKVGALEANLNTNTRDLNNRITQVQQSLQTSIKGVNDRVSQVQASVQDVVNRNLQTVAKDIQTLKTQVSANAANDASIFHDPVICNLICRSYDSRTKKCGNKFGLGSAACNPASSCKAAYNAGQRKNGAYYIGSKTSYRRAYCHQTYSGGGWELILKIDGYSYTWQYDSSYWRSNSNTLRSTEFNMNYGRDAKYDGYNKGSYKELHALFRDPHDGSRWTWTSPRGWNSGGTNPYSFFTRGRTYGSRYYHVYGYQEWKNSGGRFSSQSCAGRLGIAHCSAGHACTRWGFHWNNECGFGSNDAGGGIGNRPRYRARGAGDWVSCCQRNNGRRRDFDVIFLARVR